MAGQPREGGPYGLPGSYINGVYESRPFFYAEADYDHREDRQTVINVTNGKLVRFPVDYQPFDARYGEVRAHVRVLDIRASLLQGHVEGVFAGCPGMWVCWTRPVSLVQYSVVAMRAGHAGNRRPVVAGGAGEASSRRRAAPSRGGLRGHGRERPG